MYVCFFFKVQFCVYLKLMEVHFNFIVSPYLLRKLMQSLVEKDPQPNDPQTSA